MASFGYSSFGSSSFGGDPTPQLSLQIDAEMTQLARFLVGRGTTDGTALRSAEFSVGRGGFDPFDYSSAGPVNPGAQALDDEVFRDVIDEWEKPNDRAMSFFCALENAEANETLGEVAIWSTIYNSPDSTENGTSILFAIGHFPLHAKNSGMRYALRVVVQV